MKLIREINHIRQRFKKPVLTIGIFDGVHLAHQRIIRQVVEQAKNIKGTSIVLTFTPHPLKALKNPFTTPLITTLEHRINLIKQLNVDVCLLLDFNQEFAQIQAKDFVRHILVDLLGLSYLIVGKNFRFGKDHHGSFTLLKKLSKIYGFRLRSISPIKVNGQAISSSRIRALIQRGKITQANKLLGRKFSIYGRVKSGQARGRLLGYPTANIAPEQEIIPLAGVYAVLVKLKNKIFPGILNIGARPTFRLKKETANTIEVHLFKFQQNIYGQKLETFFIQRIRPEKKFSSHQALLQRIKKDERQAKKLLRAESPSPLKP